MTLQTVTLQNVRSYAQLSAAFHPGVNLITGANGTGKTNLLEAVWFLGCCKPLRSAKESDMIRWDSNQAEIDAAFQSGERAQTLRAVIRQTGKRLLTRNGVVLDAPRDLLGTLPSVLFRPEDLDLIRGGASERRRYLDTLLCQTQPRYLDALRRFNKICGQKREILRRHRDDPAWLALLPDYNAGLAAQCAVIAAYRSALVDAVRPLAAACHNALSGGKETLLLDYRTRTADHAATLQRLEELLPVELAQGVLLVGSHKDEIDLRMQTDGGRPRALRDTASQGQCRTAALALKLAARDVLADAFGEPPLLLLDDVLSELDAARQQVVLDHASGGQVLITCCEPGKITQKGMVIPID